MKEGGNVLLVLAQYHFSLVRAFSTEGLPDKRDYYFEPKGE